MQHLNLFWKHHPSNQRCIVLLRTNFAKSRWLLSFEKSWMQCTIDWYSLFCTLKKCLPACWSTHTKYLQCQYLSVVGTSNFFLASNKKSLATWILKILPQLIILVGDYEDLLCIAICKVETSSKDFWSSSQMLC